MESEAEKLLADLTLADLRAMEVREFPAAKLDEDGPDDPTGRPDRRFFLLAAIGLTVIFLMVVPLRSLSARTGRA